jgi:hypothetical protein
VKGKLSPFVYILAIGLSSTAPSWAEALYVLMALAWVVPDRRIERGLRGSEAPRH